MMQKLLTIFSASLIATGAQAHENMIADSFAHLFAHTGELLGGLAVLAVLIGLSVRIRKRKARLPVRNKSSR